MIAWFAKYRPFSLVLLSVMFAFACKMDNPSFMTEAEINGADTNSAFCEDGSLAVTQEFTSIAAPNLIDVLVVVSNAPGTEKIQGRLAAALPALVQQLVAKGIDFQLGIVTGDTTSQATAGSIRTSPRSDCSESPRIITSGDGEIAATFAACNAQQGQGGPAIQRLFDGARQALEVRATDPDPITGNAGFLRPQAKLLVLFVSNEDDCSNVENIDRDTAPNTQTACEWSKENLTRVDDFAQFLVTLKGLDAVSVAVVGGADDNVDVIRPNPVSRVCDDADDKPVFPATRLISLLEALSPNSHFESACASSLRGGLVRIADLTTKQNGTTLCLNNATSEPIQKVVALGDQSERLEIIAPGQDGYIFLGKSNTCGDDESAVQVNNDLFNDEISGISITFCPSL